MENKEKQETEKKEAIARGLNLPISKKQAVSLCRFIKNKKPDDIIKSFAMVLKKKAAIPMMGGIPHRKGNLMSGRYPIKAIGYFTKLIKNAVANASVKGMDTEKIRIYGISNKGSAFPRTGRIRGRYSKRTHLTIIAREKAEAQTQEKEKTEKKENKK